MYRSVATIKRFSLALGVAGAGLLVGIPMHLSAQAQSTETMAEFKLSKQGYEILCARSPLNSRCEGSQYYTGSPDAAITSPSGTTAPTQDLPSEGTSPYPTTDPRTAEPTNGAGGTSDRMRSNSPSSPSSSDSSSPSGTTAPTQTLPSEGTTPVPTTEPSGNSPSLDRPSTGGSSGGMNSNDGTAAPTQTLPGEGTTPSPNP
jgi:hypothetical protein